MTPVVIGEEMGSREVGRVSGSMVLQGDDDRLHAVFLKTWADAPIGQPLRMNGVVFVGVLYDVTGGAVTSAFLGAAGTVTLSRRCEAGLGATLEAVALREVDPTTEQAIDGGCTSTIASLAFDVGEPCP